MKAISLLINSVLPPDLRDDSRVLNKSSLDDVLAEVARRYPDQYSSIVQSISDAGRRAAYLQGETISLKDMRPVVDKDAILAKMDQELQGLGPQDLQGEDWRKKRMSIWQKYATELEKLTKDQAIAQGNSLGASVISGSRGNPFQLKAMLTTPALYTDYQDNPIELFVRRGFNEGLRPYEYLASTFGVRKSVISTKQSTAESGDLLKQLTQAAANTMVTDDDCGTVNGLDFDVGDDDLEGRVLSKSYGDIPAGTPIDKRVMQKLRSQKVTKVIARSPMTCQAKKGICSTCLGLLPDGKFAPIGYAAGITAAQAIGEPLTQGALNCLVEGTMVRMANGSAKAIEQVEVGDLILGSDCNGVSSPVQVTAKWDQGMQPCYRYTYRFGSTRQTITLESTELHPLLCNKKTYGLTNGLDNDRIVKLEAGYPHKNLAIVFPTRSEFSGLNEPFALMLGIYLGDGIRSTEALGLKMSCADRTLIRDLSKYAQPLNLKFSKRKRSHDWAISVIEDFPNQDPATGRMLIGYRNPLKKRLWKWGLIGKYAHEKQVPHEVWSWDLGSIGQLVAGFIATDGSVYQNKDGHVGISFGSTSRKMLEELKNLMAIRLCVYSSAISKTNKAGTNNYKHDMWQFYVTRHDQVTRLAGLMPKIPGIKGDTLNRYLREADYDHRHTEGFYRAKRIKIESIGLKHCWDLTVDHPDHLFVLANGIICSNTKHTGGGFLGDKKTFAGFDVIDQLVQSPETFPFKASVASIPGTVDKIEDAPQGGKFISVNGEPHYVLPGFESTVQLGDNVEAGDQMSEGIVDVYDVLKHRGLGEARKYYADRLRQAFTESGIGRPSRLNLETLARATLDHVVVDDPDGAGTFLPDDIASYNTLSATYSPPASTKTLPLANAVGNYLQVPALHFTINTKLTPKMVEQMKDAGMTHAAVTDQEPKFHPEMFRLRAATHPGTDWLAKFHTSYLTSNIQNDAARARETDIEKNIHFAPRLAVGEGFGKKIEQTGMF